MHNNYNAECLKYHNILLLPIVIMHTIYKMINYKQHSIPRQLEANGDFRDLKFCQNTFYLPYLCQEIIKNGFKKQEFFVCCSMFHTNLACDSMGIHFLSEVSK